MTFNKEKQQDLFFIIGLARSGTSILQEIMNTFSDFCNLKESRISDDIWDKTCYYAIMKNNDFSPLENFIVKKWMSKFFIEKTPMSVSCLPQLSETYPNANYIFLERNPFFIILSQLNIFPTEELQQQNKQYDIDHLNMSQDDADSLSYEHYVAKRILRDLQIQMKNKIKFTNQVTIRYEELITSLEWQLYMLSKKFKIEHNLEKAQACLLRPSYSSVGTKYNIKELYDKNAISLIKTACDLSMYKFPT